MNPFERSSDLQASFRLRLLTFWYITRYRRFKYMTGLLNVSDKHLLKTKNYGVHNASRMSLSVELFDVQEITKFGEPSGSACFFYHKFPNVSKAGVRVSTEINLFEVLLIIVITLRSCL